ncbi:MAG: YdcF family protein [Planctomycetaceae bacterium]
MPWFLFLIAAAATVVGTWRSRRLVGTGAAFVFAFLAALSWPGPLYAERMLTSLAMPVGAIWFALLATVVGLAVAGRRRMACWIGLIALALSIAGNGTVSGWLTRSLERPSFGRDPFAQGRFDAVCLLGGGVSSDRNDRPRVNAAGDRVVVAAKLSRNGQTPLVVCTGGDLRGAPNLPTVAEESASVLRDLGVPRHDIVIGGGFNTKSELATITQLKREHEWKRIGLVTSAWHLPRVERLAKSMDLEFEPLPADFRSSAVPDLPLLNRFRRFSLIPSSGALDETGAMFKEYLARLVGR